MRFYKPGQTQYQSQFAPMNLDFMQKNLMQKEENDLAVEDELNKADQLQVEGGMLSDPNEVNKYNQWLKSSVEKTREGLLTGDLSPQEAARNISKIKSIYQNNEAIKFFNTDKQLTALTRQKIAEGKANEGLSNNISYLNGKLNATPLSYKAGIDALAQGHNISTPTSMYDKENYAEQYKDLKASVAGTSFAGNPKLDLSTGVPLIMSTDGKSVDTELTRKMVEEIGLKMAPQELRNSATPWVQYNKIKYGNNYNEQQFAKDFADAYTGYYKSSIKDFDKKFSQVSGPGSGNKEKQEGRKPASPFANPEFKVGVNIDDFYKSTPLENLPLDPLSHSYTGKVDKTTRAPKQIKDLSPESKNVALYFARTNPKWRKIAENPNGNYSDLDTFYKELGSSGVLKLVEEQTVKSNAGTTAIVPGGEGSDWFNLFGSDKAVTLKELEGNSNFNNLRYYSMADKKYYTVSDLLKNAEEGGKTPISSIEEFSPENNMNFYLPEKVDGVRPIALNIDGKKFIAQSLFNPTETDRYINNIYQTIFETDTKNLKEGTPVTMQFQNKLGGIDEITIYPKYDKKKSKFILDLPGGKKEFDNANDVYIFASQNL